MSSSRPPSIDPQAAARWDAHPLAASPWLHEEVAGRMAERLEWIKLQPKAWLDWRPLAGGLDGHRRVALRYPQAVPHLVESSALRRQRVQQALAQPWWTAARWRQPRPVWAMPAPGQVDMVWANMALHASADPQALIGTWHQALATDGFLMLSCLGPDSLRELRALYAQLGWPLPSHVFTDMHDWGDMLVGAGFAEPVMDMERITLTYASPERLLADLRALGRNLHVDRHPALRSRAWGRRLAEAVARDWPQRTADGQLVLSFEVVYGHALRPAPRANVKAQTAIPLADMRALLRPPQKPG